MNTDRNTGGNDMTGFSTVTPMSESQPMPSSRIEDGRYIVLGTNHECIVERATSPNWTRWRLFVDGEFTRQFRTKRAALVYCQDHPEL